MGDDEQVGWRVRFRRESTTSWMHFLARHVTCSPNVQRLYDIGSPRPHLVYSGESSVTCHYIIGPAAVFRDLMERANDVFHFEAEYLLSVEPRRVTGVGLITNFASHITSQGSTIADSVGLALRQTEVLPDLSFAAFEDGVVRYPNVPQPAPLPSVEIEYLRKRRMSPRGIHLPPVGGPPAPS